MTQELVVLSEGGKVVIELDIGDGDYIQLSLEPDDARYIADLINKAADKVGK